MSDDNTMTNQVTPGELLDMKAREYAERMEELKELQSLLDQDILKQISLMEKEIDRVKDGVKQASLAVLSPKQSISLYGHTIRIDSPRDTVDMQQFIGYCVTHPEAKALVKTGSPRVVITEVKK